jgi:hypothetical protein
MTTTYRLLKSGKMVTVFRSTSRAPNGKDVHLTQNKIGREGDEFSGLPDFQVEKISRSIDEDEGVWEVVDHEDAEEESDGEGEPTTPIPHGHEADEGHQHETVFEGLSGERLRELVDLHALPVKGTGAQDKVLNKDMVKALQVEHGQG